MDVIKKEVETNNNSFEFNIVKVEIEEIKNELVNCKFSIGINGYYLISLFLIRITPFQKSLSYIHIKREK